MAAILSCHWYLTDDQLLFAYFTSNFPQKRPWRLCPLQPETHILLILTLSSRIRSVSELFPAISYVCHRKNVIQCKQSAQWIPYFEEPKILRSIQPEDWKSQCFCSSKAIAHLICIIPFYFLLCPSKYTRTVSDYQAFSPNKNKIIMKWKAFFVSNFERINKINNDNNEGGEKNSTKELIIISIIIIIRGPLVSVIANM